MRKYAIVTLGLVILMLSSISFAGDPVTFEEGYQKWRDSKSKIGHHRLMLDGIGSYPTIDADSTHSYDAIHLDITLESSVWDSIFDVTVEMLAVSEENNLSEFDFNLIDCMITDLQVDGITSTYTHEGDQVIVNLPEIMMEGDTIRVAVNYTGRVQFENNNEGGLIFIGGLFTLGEPYGTRTWLACFDYPFDKVTSTMTTIVPIHYDVLSNGYLVEETELPNSRKRVVWQNDDPVSTYLISLVARDYEIIEDGVYGVNDTPVTFWVYEDFIEEATYDMGRTGEMIEWYEELFGPYPFNKYDQGMAYIFGGWGAMEHQSCTTMGTFMIRWGDRRYERIVAHELAHQWWGDYVGPLSFKNIWLNEGFATYGEPLWAENTSIEERQAVLQSLETRYFADDARHRFPLYDPPYDPENGVDELFSATIYDKGALVLHVLRWVIGDEDFFDGLRYYAEQHAYGSATTAEFQENMEHVSSMDLTDFFEQWVYQAGYPEYVLDNYESEANGDLWTASFTIDQVQDNAPLFTTPVPVLLTNGVADTLCRIEMSSANRQNVTVENLHFEPTSIQFDPEGWILCTADDSRTNVEEPSLTVSDFSLTEPWPNPFNSTTTFGFDLPVTGIVKINIYDLLGREVDVIADRLISAGNHRFSWTPDAGTASGTYLIKVKAESRTETKKVILLK